MLNPEIAEFVEMLKKLNTVGCITVPRRGLNKLSAALKAAGEVCHAVFPATDLKSIVPPALLVVSEEDYSKDGAWAEKLREKAAYFFNVKG